MDDDNLKQNVESPPMGDDSTPFSVPDDVTSDDSSELIDEELEKEIDLTHPVLDVKPDATELYQEGVNGAVEAKEPYTGASATDEDLEDSE